MICNSFNNFTLSAFNTLSNFQMNTLIDQIQKFTKTIVKAIAFRAISREIMDY